MTASDDMARVATAAVSDDMADVTATVKVAARGAAATATADVLGGGAVVTATTGDDGEAALAADARPSAVGGLAAAGRGGGGVWAVLASVGGYCWAGRGDPVMSPPSPPPGLLVARAYGTASWAQRCRAAAAAATTAGRGAAAVAVAEQPAARRGGGRGRDDGRGGGVPPRRTPCHPPDLHQPASQHGGGGRRQLCADSGRDGQRPWDGGSSRRRVCRGGRASGGGPELLGRQGSVAGRPGHGPLPSALLSTPGRPPPTAKAAAGRPTMVTCRRRR